MTNALLRPRAMAIALGLALAASVGLSTLTNATPIVGAAQSDYYLKIDGIDGESTTNGHEKGIQIESWSWGTSNSSSSGYGGGMGSGKMSAKALTITKTIDTTSPAIFMACASGKRIKNAVLTAVRPSSDGKGSDYVTVNFSDVFCSSFQHSGSSSDRPMESLSLNFTKIEMKVMPPAGSTTKPTVSGWDLKMNKGF